MQRNEIIIEQFIKTIKGSSSDVEGDPVLLNNIFEALDKKKRRKKVLGFFLTISVVLGISSLVVWGIYGNETPLKESKSMIVPSTQIIPDVHENVVAVVTNDEDEKVKPTKKVSKTKNKKQDDGNFENVVTYKFNDHQVDVFKDGGDEFIQINVFGADGEEQDVLKIMEDLKKSYRNNSVYVDSVKHK